jgi:hypothetical protein
MATTAIADPLTITTWALDLTSVHSGPHTATADPLTIRVSTSNRTYAIVEPASTLQTHAYRGDWGGVVICRPGVALLDDLETLTDAGFRVLGTVERAGETQVFVFATEQTCHSRRRGAVLERRAPPYCIDAALSTH